MAYKDCQTIYMIIGLSPERRAARMNKLICEICGRESTYCDFLYNENYEIQWKCWGCGHIHKAFNIKVC